MRNVGEFALAIVDQDKRFVPGMNSILDMRLVTDPANYDPGEETSFQNFSDELAARSESMPDRKIAIIVNSDVSYGISRMRGVELAKNPTLNFNVFLTMQEVVDWLGIPGLEGSELVTDDNLTLSLSFDN